MFSEPLLFQSTRSSSRTVTLLEAVEQGLAPDGGLYLPVEIPKVDWDSLPSTTFAECSVAFLSQWLVGSMKQGRIEALVDEALNFEVPLVPLQNGSDYRDTRVLELFHGPTLSFKDFGARTMAFLLRERIRDTGQPITILVATSGDTGSAVADGLSGIEGIRVVLLYPASQVSPVQEKQLIVQRDGVLALRVEGNFDDCQRLVKGAFERPDLAGLNLSTANSINIGRLLPQMLYYVWATRSLMSRDVSFVVPSGNLGNLTAGVMAHLSGMPVRQFIAAHNDNDFFPRYLLRADTTFDPSVRTVSNAMDVGAPSNFERIKALLPYPEMTRLIHGFAFSDERTLESMQDVYRQTGYIADPHTAVGLAAAKALHSTSEVGQPMVVLSTAHPAKFPDIVKQATRVDVEVPERLKDLDRRPERVTDVAPDPESFARAVLAHEW